MKIIQVSMSCEFYLHPAKHEHEITCFNVKSIYVFHENAVMILANLPCQYNQPIPPGIMNLKPYYSFGELEWISIGAVFSLQTLENNLTSP